MTAPRRHDFAADRAQLGWMHPVRHLTVLAGAALLLGSGAAAAQTGDTPVSTAGSRAGGVPVEPAPDAAPGKVRETPAPPPIQPSRRYDDMEAAADSGRHAPLLGDYHGEVGAVVGTNGTRGAYGRIVSHPTDNTAIDLRFSTMHQNGYYPYAAYGGGPFSGGPYGFGGYDRRDRYRPDLEALAPDPLFPPD